MDLKSKRSDFQRHVDALKDGLRGLRTGRASASLVDQLLVEAYGALTPIQHLASISVPDARTVLITPWDKTVVKDIEKAIVNANIGVNPLNDGAGVRIIIPAMTEENRKNLIKVLGQKVEHAKIAVRSERDRVRDEIAKAEKANELTEDDRFELQQQLDEMTREFTGILETMSDEKEKDIMTI